MTGVARVIFLSISCNRHIAQLQLVLGIILIIEFIQALLCLYKGRLGQAEDFTEHLLQLVNRPVRDAKPAFFWPVSAIFRPVQIAAELARQARCGLFRTASTDAEHVILWEVLLGIVIRVDVFIVYALGKEINLCLWHIALREFLPQVEPRAMRCFCPERPEALAVRQLFDILIANVLKHRVADQLNPRFVARDTIDIVWAPSIAMLPE